MELRFVHAGVRLHHALLLGALRRPPGIIAALGDAAEGYIPHTRPCCLVIDAALDEKSAVLVEDENMDHEDVLVCCAFGSAQNLFPGQVPVNVVNILA